MRRRYDPLLRGRWLKEGAHVDLVGAFRPDLREADDEAMRRARIFVDTREGAFGEAGDILQALASLCHRLDGRLRRSAARGHTATIKVRFADFTMVSRSTTQRETFAHEAELIAAAQALWARVDRAGRGVRLLGVGVAGLEPRHDSEQLTLDTRSAHPATAVVDEIRSRFGDDAVLPGRFVSPPRHGETPTESGENLPG